MHALHKYHHRTSQSDGQQIHKITDCGITLTTGRGGMPLRYCLNDIHSAVAPEMCEGGPFIFTHRRPSIYLLILSTQQFKCHFLGITFIYFRICVVVGLNGNIYDLSVCVSVYK